MKRDVRIISQRLNKVVPVDRTELDVFHLVVPGELTRHFVGNIQVPPIIYVHAQLYHGFISCLWLLAAGPF